MHPFLAKQQSAKASAKLEPSGASCSASIWNLKRPPVH
jgi:hypothetical protein